MGGSQGGYPSDPLTLPVLPKPPQKTLNQRQPIQNIQTESLVLLSTKEITFPVLPPTFFRVLPRPWAAFVRAGPADADTRVRPSVALAAADEAVCWALEAASEADEACLTVVVVVVLRVKACCDCRRATARETATGILTSDCVGISETTGRRLSKARVARGTVECQLTGWCRESRFFCGAGNNSRFCVRELQEAARDLPCFVDGFCWVVELRGMFGWM